METKRLFVEFTPLFSTITAVAQSVSYARSLINQVMYLDSAKRLRPLADGGNPHL